MIIQETKYYAHKMKIKFNYHITKDELKAFIDF